MLDEAIEYLKQLQLQVQVRIFCQTVLGEPFFRIYIIMNLNLSVAELVRLCIWLLEVEVVDASNMLYITMCNCEISLLDTRRKQF